MAEGRPLAGDLQSVRRDLAGTADVLWRNGRFYCAYCEITRQVIYAEGAEIRCGCGHLVEPWDGE